MVQYDTIIQSAVKIYAQISAKVRRCGPHCALFVGSCTAVLAHRAGVIGARNFSSYVL